MNTADTITTPLGLVNAQAANDHFVCLSADGMNINGVTHSWHLKLEKTGNSWGPECDNNGQSHHALYVNSRWNGQKHVEATPAARRKLLTVMQAAFARWIQTPDAAALLRAAQLEAWAKETARHQETIAQLQKEIREHEAEVNAIAARVAGY